MKYLMTISYDGSKYNGLQKLNGKKTVQGELEEVLSKMNEKQVHVKASGRTDKGVHAIGQKCHFELDKPTTTYKLRYYINRSTSPYIYVKELKEVADDNFHARFSVKSKVYEYRINVGEYDPLTNDYAYNFNQKLDIRKMKHASHLFIGEHNFKAFVVDKHKTYDSYIEYINIKKKNDIIYITFAGKAFYTYMVRNMVSALILVGSDKIDECIIDEMLKTGTKVIEYAPVPASGLYLKEVIY